MIAPPERPRVASVLRNGFRRRCPRCGIGPLFRRGIETHERCSECGLLYQRNYGDIWGFIIIMDRIPVGLAVVAIYFGFQSTSWMLAAGSFIALAGPLLATIRQRQGVAIALDYLSRVYLPDPSDEIHAGRQQKATG
jgi:uncharacterized protein (DUF983 family)